MNIPIMSRIIICPGFMLNVPHKGILQGIVHPENYRQ
jgi:hypothetical protein